MCLPRSRSFRVESCFIVPGAMPLKKKRQKQLEQRLEKAREAKRIRTVDEGTSDSADTEVQSGAEPRESNLSGLLSMSDDALDTEDENADPCFDLDTSMKSYVEHLAENFCEDWVSHLERDDWALLGLFLCFQLTKHLDLGDTKAAEIAGMMIGRSDKTVCEWRKQNLKDGEIPESKQGKYQRSGVMWSSEELNKKAARYIRENANVKGQPNLTAGKFCQWVNDDLLPNQTLEPRFPRKISLETARKWVLELCFNVVRKKKGTYVDGNEHDDVVKCRQKFLQRMVSLGFLNEMLLTEEAKKALQSNLHGPPQEVAGKTIILFHDELTFQSKISPHCELRKG